MSGSVPRQSMDRGWVTKPGIRKKAGGGKRKHLRFNSPEEAERDRKFRTGVRVKAKTKYRKWDDEADTES